MSDARFVTAGPAESPEGATRSVAFVGERAWIHDGAEGTALFAPLPPEAEIRSRVALGTYGGERWEAVELARPPEAPKTRTTSLRALIPFLEPELFLLVGTAAQLVTWRRTHRFCGSCGKETRADAAERAMVCDACELRSYPRVSPAAIVLVEDGDSVLLTRKRGFPTGMYGLVAGFLEPGETLEACAAREVMEETGIEVEDVRYHGSQPWPFPHQVMVGFFAKRTGGELRVDTTELEDARFFPRDALPLLPPPFSIARSLLDRWCARG